MSITKKKQKREKIGKRISRIIRERLQTSTKVEVREYHELCSSVCKYLACNSVSPSSRI